LPRTHRTERVVVGILVGVRRRIFEKRIIRNGLGLSVVSGGPTNTSSQSAGVCSGTFAKYSTFDAIDAQIEGQAAQ
jgi:hypothetical protein